MSASILAIDPGPTESGIVLWDNGVQIAKVENNEQLRFELQTFAKYRIDLCAIEMIACYGMPVGKETFETCVWIGRFIECCMVKPHLVYRRDIKHHLCNSAKAKDANIRQALIDKHGAPGTKKAPGVTYGITGHLWAALAVADYALDKLAQ